MSQKTLSAFFSGPGPKLVEDILPSQCMHYDVCIAFKFTAWCVFAVLAQSNSHHIFDLFRNAESHLKKGQPKRESNFLINKIS